MHQVVAGANWHITLQAQPKKQNVYADRVQYEDKIFHIDGVVHQDLRNEYHMKHLGRPRRAPRWDREEGSDWVDSEASKASTAADSQAVPRVTADSSNKGMHVPEWALWLNGAVVTMLIAVIIALLYVVSTTRRRLASGTTVELNKVQNPASSRTESQAAVEIVSTTHDTSSAALKASNPRSPTSTEIRSRSGSREGVICLD